MTTKTAPYSGPWPRKRHYHRCETCWRTRKQGAVYCYKGKCSRPLSVESCECCRPLTPTATYTPTAKFERELAEDHGRTRIGNTPTCEDCDQALDHCECEDEAPAETNEFNLAPAGRQARHVLAV